MASADVAYGVVAPPIVDGIVHAVVYGKGYGVNEFLEAQGGLKPPGTSGWWDRVLPELSDGQRADLLEAGRSREISHRAIAVVLGKWGHTVTPAQVGHWRRTHVR